MLSSLSLHPSLSLPLSLPSLYPLPPSLSPSLSFSFPLFLPLSLAYSFNLKLSYSLTLIILVLLVSTSIKYNHCCMTCFQMLIKRINKQTYLSTNPRFFGINDSFALASVSTGSLNIIVSSIEGGRKVSILLLKVQS